jgi:hypothetical protein
MKISCCWLYAISKYGYPPSLEDTFKVLGEMRDMGFTSVELEGVREAEPDGGVSPSRRAEGAL